MSSVVLTDDQQRRVYQALLTEIVRETEGVKFYFGDADCVRLATKFLHLVEEEIRRG